MTDGIIIEAELKRLSDERIMPKLIRTRNRNWLGH